MSEQSTSWPRIAFYLGAAFLAAVSIYTWLQRPDAPLHMALRLTGLLGYVALFLATLLAEYVRQVPKIFDRPFLKMHHFLAIAGLALIVAHPLSLALLAGDPAVFVPTLGNVRIALQNGGRIAIYLFLLAALAAWQSRRIGFWRTVHFLNYAALILAAVHGLMIGEDLQGTILTVLWPLMALVAVGVFVHKRMKRSRP